MNELITNQPIIEEKELADSGKSAANQKTNVVINNKNKTIEFSVPSKFNETKCYVGKSPVQGLGCFAKQNINAGEIIEEVSAILLDTTVKTNKDWVVSKYCFTWPCDAGDQVCMENGSTYVMPTGNAMIYNHSDSPNSYWIYDKAMKRMFIAALRDIEEGEEIFWYYGNGYAKSLREGNFRLEKPKSGCSSCQKRNLQQSMAKESPVVNENTFNQKHLRVGTNNPFNSHLKANTNLYNEMLNLNKTDIEFRSMVVPEKKIDDNIQNG